MKRHATIALAIFSIVFIPSLVAYSSITYLKSFDFNSENALDKWNRMILNGQVKYILMKQGANGFVEAFSDKTCSALYYRLGFKPEDYPLLTWRWRVLRFPDLSSARTAKERDDYAARVYVIFPFLSFSSSKFIEYVWAEDLPAGTVMKSPNGENIGVIVVNSGKANSEQWVSQTRNVYEDYIKVFGTRPRLGVGAIAIMCNADHTKTQAEANFDDIAVGTETGPKRRLSEI